MFSHLDPDHVNGFRVVEQLNLDYQKNPPSNKNKPINILLTKLQYNILSRLNSQYGPFLGFFEKLNLVKSTIIDRNTKIWFMTQQSLKPT